MSNIPNNITPGSLASSNTIIKPNANTNSINPNTLAANKDNLSNLDANKLKQLSPEQRKALQGLSPTQLKALNKLPIGQWKNLSPDMLKGYANKLPIDKLNSAKDQLEKLKKFNKQKLEELKNANDPNKFLKSQNKIDPATARNAIVALVLPMLMKFINAEKVANLIVNKLINDTKKKLKNKGRFTVVNGAITFTPKDKANYQAYKDNFDRRVSTLKNIVNILKTIVDTLLTILRIARVALAAFKAYLALTNTKIKVSSTSASADLASPNWSKPAAATYVIDKEVSQSLVDPLKDKIDKYTLLISFIINILTVCKRFIDALKIKLDRLSFTIITAEDQPIYFNSLASTLTFDNPNETEIEVGDKSYTIKVITTLSGALQAVAYDKFSGLKVTQTAPSKIRKSDQLIDELKQILGQ
jgi:hypothetical protein